MDDFVVKIKITNKAMVAFFLEKGVKPIDILLGAHKTIVFVYNIAETTPYYAEWKEREPETRHEQSR